MQGNEAFVTSEVYNSSEVLIVINNEIIIGMLGTAIGVMAALLPQEVTNKRNHFMKMKKLWILLDKELNQITTQCNNNIDAIQPALDTANQNAFQNIALNIFAPLPHESWRIASTSELVLSAPPELLQDIYKLYLGIQTLNDTINHYSTFAETSRALRSAVRDIAQFYKTIGDSCLAIKIHAEKLKSEYSKEILINTDCEHKWNLIIESLVMGCLFWFGVLMGMFANMLYNIFLSL